MTIKMRILIPMIVFTVIASLAVLISNIAQFSRYVGMDMARRLDAASLAAISRIEGLEARAGAASLYLAKDSAIIKALESADRKALFERAVQMYNDTGIDVGFCSITDASGVIVACAHSPQSQGLDASGVSCIKSALSGKPMTTIEPGVSLRMSICSAAPIYDERGTLLGVIIVGFRMDTNDFVDYIKAMSDCEVTICQADERISTTIIQADGTRATGTKAPAEISRTVLAGNIYSGRAEVLYDDMITRYVPIFGADGKAAGMLFVGHYTVEEMNTVSSFVAAGLAFIMILSAISAVIISIIADRIVAPINEAAGVLNEIARGNFDSRVEGEYNGDLALIKNSVNQAAADLSLYLNEKLLAEHTAHEAELAKARAEEASTVKSAFLANMSHEIRTPMNAVIDIADLLLAEDLSFGQRRYAVDIKAAGINLLGIINDILDMSKIEAGKFEIVPVHYDLNAMLENMDSIFIYTARSKNIEYRSVRREGLPDCLMGDDIRLRQVLTNLIGNAVKFTSDGYVELRAWADADSVFFDVEDTGIGIRREDLPILFDPFQQADVRTNRSKAGTGLGLSISKSIVEAMGGILTVESDYGRGSIFHVSIPRVDGDPSKVRPAAREFISAPSADVLLVDDFDVNLYVTAGLLKLSDISCDMAASGREAISMVRNKKYDIIFMDHIMPEMDGAETTRQLRDMGFAREDYPIIALTAHDIAGIREMLTGCGMNDFLSKPVDRVMLNEALIKWLPSEKIQAPRRGEVPALEVPAGAGGEISRLRQTAGLDVDAGLALTGGSESLYMDALRIITKRIPELLTGMSGFLESGALDRFAIDIHGVKNSLATAGAHELSGIALGMETRAKAGDADYCEAVFPDFAERLSSLHEALSKIFFLENETPLQPGDRRKLSGQLGEIRRCVEAFDDETALEILASLAGFDFGEQINDLLKTLNWQIEMFEYQNSKNSLDDLEHIL